MTNKELLRTLYQHIYYHSGKRCKDFNYGCWNCQQWMAYDILRDSIKVSELQPAKAEEGE
jgi:DNA primase large subunit